MNREKALFLIVLVIALLWGGLALTGSYEPPRGRLTGRVPDLTAPRPEVFPDRPAPERFLRWVAGTDALPPLVPERGRNPLVRYSSLRPVEPADLPLPRALTTSIVLPPISPFPTVEYYHRFRADPASLTVAEAKEEGAGGGEEAGAGAEGGGEEPSAAPAEEEVLDQAKKKEWEFIPSQWDRIEFPAGEPWYGRISLRKEQTAKGHTKYDLLLPENRNLPFYFEKWNTSTGKPEIRGVRTLEEMKAKEVVFADTVENRYWSHRVLERVGKDDASALVRLADWIMDLADREGYDRLKGLDLAVRTAREALAARPGDLEAELSLTEALHRAFRYEEEMAVYEEALARKPDPRLLARRARLLVAIDALESAERDLTESLSLAPGHVPALLLRAEVRYRLGVGGDPRRARERLEGALADYREVERSGVAEDQARGRAGRARVLLTLGRPEEAEALLEGAEDAPSLVTRGACRYALRDFPGAVEVFQAAVDADPGLAEALTGLGFAKLMAARDAAGIDEAVEILGRARFLDPLNVFEPPLGQGFAELRRGNYLASLDRLTTAEAALPTHPYGHYILGVSYLRDGRPADARREFEKALEINWRFLDALDGVGTAALRTGDHQAAREHYRRVLDLEERRLAGAEDRDRALRDAAFARYRLGRAFLVSEDLPDEVRLEKAAEHFRKIVALDPRVVGDVYVAAHNALGWVLYQQGEVEEALRFFDLAKRLAPGGDPRGDAHYAEEAKAKVYDADSQRIWEDDFERPDAGLVSNGWTEKGPRGFVPRLKDGKAVLAGRQPEDEGVWLTRGDRTLNAKFIHAEAELTVPRTDRVLFRFLVYSTKGRSGAFAKAIGFEKSPRGELFVIHRQSSAREFTRVPVKDEAGNPLPWPDGTVTLRIARVGEKGGFTLSVNGNPVATIPLGWKRRSGPLYFGFSWSATRGEAYSTTIERVTLRRYK